jgi:maleate cis-trans isomerase
MPNPFPGMNPYLENHEFWSEVHLLLIAILQESLVPQLVPKYRVAIEKRVYEIKGEQSLLVGIPDVSVLRNPPARNPITSNVAVAAPATAPVQVTLPMPEEVRERYLEIVDMATKEVVTVIEVLSPANKRPGKGREMYEEKRDKVFGSCTHLVEIDLLRRWEPLPVLETNIAANYRILVSRADRRPQADLYLFNIRDAIPCFPLPLRAPDVEPIVDLQALLNAVYDRAGYDFTVDYSCAPVPPLSETDAVWADALLRERGLRG